MIPVGLIDTGLPALYKYNAYLVARLCTAERDDCASLTGCSASEVHESALLEGGVG